MTQFSIEKYKPGMEVVTRDGRPARILATDVNNPRYPVAAAVRDSNGSEETYTFARDGIYNAPAVSIYDLFFKDSITDDEVSFGEPFYRVDEWATDAPLPSSRLFRSLYHAKDSMEDAKAVGHRVELYEIRQAKF